jgi:hypothetical protein
VPQNTGELQSRKIENFIKIISNQKVRPAKNKNRRVNFMPVERVRRKRLIEEFE